MRVARLAKIAVVAAAVVKGCNFGVGPKKLFDAILDGVS